VRVFGVKKVQKNRRCRPPEICRLDWSTQTGCVKRKTVLLGGEKGESSPGRKGGEGSRGKKGN